MSMLADRLRKQAEELRAEAAVLKSKLDASSSASTHLRSQLILLQSVQSITEVRARLSVLAESLTGESVSREAFIVGVVTANVYDGLADIAEVFVGLDPIQHMREQRLARMEINRKMNLAAAKGDWDEFDKLTTEYAESIAGGGTSSDSGESSSGESSTGTVLRAATRSRVVAGDEAEE